MNTALTSVLLAAMVVTSMSAAEGGALTAEIPFSFQTHQGNVMPSGSYRFVENSYMGGGKMFIVKAVGSPKSVLIRIDSAANVSAKSSGPAHLTFACVQNSCALTEIWSDGQTGYRTPLTAPKVDPERVRYASIALHR